jgi:exosortase D (VPLPA-CTERM-specific)
MPTIEKRFLVIYALAYLVLLVFLYASSHAAMVGRWAKDEYNYCYIIPFIFAYLVWEKRAELGRTPRTLPWLGLAPLVLGVGLYWIGELGGEFYALYLSSWLVVLGLAWLHLGGGRVRVLAFPFAILLTMLPLPAFLHNSLSVRLQLVSSRLGVELMQLFQVPVYREGNIIDLGFTRLQVVEACNGLRYIFPLLVLGLVLGYFFRAPLWKRILLVVSAVPLAVAVNSLRVGVTGILSLSFGPKVAEGFFHDFSGWLVFMFSLGVLLLEMLLLARLPGRAPARNQEEPAGPGPDAAEPGPARKWLLSPRFWVPVALLGATLALTRQIDFREQTPIRRPLAEFPLDFGPWHGSGKALEARFLEQLDLTDYLTADYAGPDGRPVNLYVAWYASQAKGESIHSPASCLPGSGWVFEESGAHVPQIPGAPPGFRVNRAFMRKDGASQLVYYWFPQRGRVLTSAVELKLFTFWDALVSRRTDGALVRVITPLGADEEPADGDRRLEAFLAEVLPRLGGFIPGKDPEGLPGDR